MQQDWMSIKEWCEFPLTATTFSLRHSELHIFQGCATHQRVICARNVSKYARRQTTSMLQSQQHDHR